jgi:two-component system sensor histidine kinase/response regulator
MSNYKVLLAEDNQVNQEVGRTMMETFGCMVDVASNGCEVLERMESCRYDIVFMDCEMPIMGGLEATRKIREREKQQGKPRATIVALTARSTAEDRDRCLDVGMDDYLGKPFRMVEISRMIDKWCLKASAPYSPVKSEDPELKTGQSDTGSESYLNQKSLDSLRTLGQNRPKMLSIVLDIYLNDTPVLVDRLGESFTSGDLDGVSRTAHALKSSSLGLGATIFAEMCRQLENIAGSNSIDRVEILISRIRSEYVRVEEAMRKELAKGV